MNSLKKYLVYLVCTVILLTQAALPFAVSAKETSKEYMNDNKIDVSGTPYVRTDSGIAGQKFTVSDGNFVGMVIPSWYVGNLDVYVVVYKWDTDYSTTIRSSALFVDLIKASSPGVWVDPGQQDFEIKFDRAFAPGDYLVTYMNYADPLYLPTVERMEGAVAFLDGKELEGVTYRTTVITDDEVTVNEEPNIKYDGIVGGASIRALYGIGASSDGESYFPIFNFENVGVRFKVENERLTGFILNSLQIDSGFAEITVSLYRWNTDYTATKGEKAIFEKTYEIEDDGTLANYQLDFDGYVFAEGEYLVVLESLDGIRLWAHAKKEGVAVYFDDDEYEFGTIKVSAITNISKEVNEPDPNATPTAAPETPTPSPTETPTETVSEVPTQTSAPTRLPSATGDDSDTNNGGNTAIIIVAAAAGVIIIAVVIIIILKKKKK